MKNLYEIVRNEVMSNLIEKSSSTGGSDLNEVRMSIMEIKDVLYDTLMKIEIRDVRERWKR